MLDKQRSDQPRRPATASQHLRHGFCAERRPLPYDPRSKIVPQALAWCRKANTNCIGLRVQSVSSGRNFLEAVFVPARYARPDRSIVAWHQSQADVRAGNGAVQRRDGYVNDVQRFGRIIKILEVRGRTKVRCDDEIAEAKRACDQFDRVAVLQRRTQTGHRSVHPAISRRST